MFLSFQSVLRQRHPVFSVVSVVILLFLSIYEIQAFSSTADPVPTNIEVTLLPHLKKIWDRKDPVNETNLGSLRQTAWDMFDFGFNNYLRHAFPKDHLMPISCQGDNFQGGMALTLVDALDTLVMMQRRGDLKMAVERLGKVLDFDMDSRVHVFETSIRVLGGLISGHILLSRDPSLVPTYRGLFLEQAVALADRLLPAFNTRSGIPYEYVHLQRGEELNIQTCTACAGTFLLEFGALSMLTGNPVYLRKAHRAALTMYRKRSRLGLVGGAMHVMHDTWASRETTIGPGSDSYYEYLLKAYLLLGEEKYLDMFADLYTSTMRHLQVPTSWHGTSFLADVHMDSGQLTTPWVSSLGAFWPGMQALAGLERDAMDLHDNFTSAWRTFGWLPESFGFDLNQVHPRDPGYRLRPEHVESTFMLHALTGDPRYWEVARNIQEVLGHTRVACGYADIGHVATGAHHDLMESFFLSETVKYLYMIFSNASGLIDYFVLTTEAHLLPPFQHEQPQHLDEDEHIPEECEKVCRLYTAEEKHKIWSSLRSAYPMLQLKEEDADVLRARRCRACVVVEDRLSQHPPVTATVKEQVMKAPQPWAYTGILSQIVLGLAVDEEGQLRVSEWRPLTDEDLVKGVPENSMVLQLKVAEYDREPVSTLLVNIYTPQGTSTAEFIGTTAHFGPFLPVVEEHCLQALRSPVTSGARPGTCSSSLVHEDSSRSVPAWSLKMGVYSSHDELMDLASHRAGPGPDSLISRMLLSLDVSSRTGVKHPCHGTHIATGPIVISQPPHACSTVGTKGDLKGAIALVLRGNCSFMQKVKNMESLGAIGVVVINHEMDDKMIRMAPDEGAQDVSIPSTLITRADGIQLLRWVHKHLVVGTLMSVEDSRTSATEGEALPTRLNVIFPNATRTWMEENMANPLDSNAIYGAILAEQGPAALLLQLARGEGT